MLHLIPAPVHRTGLCVAHALRKLWWRWRRPSVVGCRALAIDGAGRVLLIRHSYGSQKWMPPGGGVDRSEAPLAAAVRELREETGCRMARPRVVACVIEPLHGARNIIHVIAGRTDDAPLADGREVIEAAFFALDALPAEMSGRLRLDLPAWMEMYRLASVALDPGVLVAATPV